VRARLHRAQLLPKALFVAFIALSLLSPFAHAAEPDLSAYVYEDTKQLVTLVNDAAALMARKGEAAFADFQVPHSYWRHGDYYIFIYTIDGICVFQPEEPVLVGKNLMDLRDIGGRPMNRGITDIARRPEPDASGWVFYLWEDHARLAPSWKASYIRKVVTPDHKVYALGSGLFNPKTERVFIKDNVDRAVDLLLQRGKGALEQLHDPSFSLLDSYIFVIDEHGHVLVDPAFPTNELRDLWDFTDAVGSHVIQNVLQRLATEDEAWLTYLQPQPGSRAPSRKLMYVRKVMVGGEKLFVGSDYFLAIPIWMKAENNSEWPRDPPT
jgi:signal transduction histidine kinase